MKRLLYISMGLILAVFLLALVFGGDDAGTPANDIPAVEASAVPILDEDTVATEAVSPSSVYSRKLRGVFIKSLTCSPDNIRLGDSIDVDIKEAWLEKIWEPASGGLLGEPDYAKGYARDSLNPGGTQLVLAFKPSSKLGHFAQYAWKIARADDGPYREHQFTKTRGNQLVMGFISSNAVFPIKYYVSYCPEPGLDCTYVKADSLFISE